MNYFRAIRSGFIVWMLVATTFIALSIIPGTRDSFLLQSIIVAILMVCYATFGALMYYRKGNREHGIKVGLVISATALILDMLITVPFFEIPAGRSYQSFFTSPVLWILVFINILTLYVFYKRRTMRAESF
jgi:hypothetical protein